MLLQFKITFMWNFILGPIFALLPKPWRSQLPFLKSVSWKQATMVSGITESLAAIVGLGYWYMYEMSKWVDRTVSAAIDGKLAVNVSVQEVGAMALTVWMQHPLTWALGYFMVEGMVRLGAAMSEQSPGILPLALVDGIFIRPFRRRNPANPMEARSAAGNARSFAAAVCEGVMGAGGGAAQDELFFGTDGGAEFLEIRAPRRKVDWDPPRVVRFEDSYYRLEGAATKSGSRPFCYTLRRLSAGVPGRNVLLYSPSDAIIRRAEAAKAMR